MVTEKQDRVFELALAALLHDVGKPLQRAATREESQSLAVDRDVFCPSDSKTGQKTHHHAAYTGRFLAEALKRLVPQGRGDENIVGWAARHHLPKSPWDWVVAEADRLSSGMDRGYTDESWGGWGQVVGARLAPVLARVSPSGPRPDPGPARFKLGPLSLDSKSLFPAGTDLQDVETGRKEYGALCRGFESDFRRYVGEVPLNLDATIRSTLAVVARHFWAVPAATNTGLCDVSLFDHLRTAGALAANLAAGLVDAGLAEGDETWVKSRGDARHVLVAGDVSGIQRYITAVVRKGAAKSLRGRSFAIQLLTDGIAEALLAKLGLPACNVLYAGGGHFWILAPSSRVDGLDEWAESVDAWLLEWSGGTLGFGVGRHACTGQELVDKKMAGVREAATGDLHRARGHRLRSLARTQYDRIFGVEEVEPEARPCGACGRDFPSENPDDPDTLCPVCNRAEALGRVLPRAERLLRLPGPSPQGIRALADRDGWVHFGGPLACGYALQENADGGSAPPGTTAFGLDAGLPRLRLLENVSVGMWPLGRNAPRDPGGELLEYDALARKTSGVPALGVLAMDVDNLGSLFRSGFSEKDASLSRLSSLSWHLTLFFAGRLGQLIEQNDLYCDAVQIVYSGGDDVLLVGAFDRLPPLAAEIRREFRAFAGANGTLSLSAGIAHGSSSVPVLGLVREAQEAEAAAKSYRTPRKDAVSVLGVPMTWEELTVSACVARDLSKAVGSDELGSFEPFKLPGAPPAGLLPRAILQRLLAIARMEHKSRATAGSGGQIEGIRAAALQGRWAWMAAYQLDRLGERRKEALAFVRQLRDALGARTYQGLTGDRHLIEYLEVPVSWAFMTTRKANDRREDVA